MVSALLKAIDRGEKYSIRAVTRNPDGPKAADLKAKGCEVVKCDMDDTASVNQGVAGSYGVFLVTNYWEHFSKEKEIEQGKRVIDASAVQGVKHLIYSGLENVKDLMGLDVGELINYECVGSVEEVTKKAIFKTNIWRLCDRLRTCILRKLRKKENVSIRVLNPFW